MSIQVAIHIHDNDTRFEGEQLETCTERVKFETFAIIQGADEVKLFLDRKAAKAMIDELERLYPELGAAPTEGNVAIHNVEEPPSEVIVAYAMSGAATAPLNDIDAAIAELSTTPNAAKFDDERR